jgi:hypothetical protein
MAVDQGLWQTTSHYTTFPFDTIGGNYQPALHYASIADETAQLTVVTSRVTGAASLATGELELKLMRDHKIDNCDLGPADSDTSLLTQLLQVVLVAPSDGCGGGGGAAAAARSAMLDPLVPLQAAGASARGQDAGSTGAGTSGNSMLREGVLPSVVRLQDVRPLALWPNPSRPAAGCTAADGVGGYAAGNTSSHSNDSNSNSRGSSSSSSSNNGSSQTPQPVLVRLVYESVDAQHEPAVPIGLDQLFLPANFTSVVETTLSGNEQLAAVCGGSSRVPHDARDTADVNSGTYTIVMHPGTVRTFVGYLQHYRYH